MRLIWARMRKAPQPPMDRMHFVVWDFLKMFTAAVLCGLLVSVASAGLALLLSGNAAAAAQEADAEGDETPFPATPGSLIVGDGCGGEVIAPMERDWHVAVDGKRVTVRVMQSYSLPRTGSASAVFHVQLLQGARLTGLSVQTGSTDWSGHLLSADKFERLSEGDYLALTKSRILVSQSPRGSIVTSPILDSVPGSVITVSYTYVMTASTTALELPLEHLDESTAAAAGEMPDDEPAPRRPPTSGNVWVQWAGHRPARVDGAPADTEFETHHTGIDGLSWATHQLQPGARFHITWAL